MCSGCGACSVCSLCGPGAGRHVMVDVASFLGNAIRDFRDCLTVQRLMALSSLPRRGIRRVFGRGKDGTLFSL